MTTNTNHIFDRTGTCYGNEPYGVCPVCKKTNGYINIGRGHWFFCREHKVRWLVGSNLFSSWKDQTTEEQEQTFNNLNFGEYETLPANKVYYENDR